MITKAVVIASVSFLSAAPCFGQTPSKPDSNSCSSGERLQQDSRGKLSPPATTGQNLSDKLERGEGVLCPPNVDPDIQAPTPDTGDRPVVRPPGSPGGDPTVRPK